MSAVNMASNKAPLASGADFDAQATRQRKVPSTSPSGSIVDRVEIDEKKTQVKKVRQFTDLLRRLPWSKLTDEPFL